VKNFIEKLFPSLEKKIAVAVILVLLVTSSIFIFIAQKTGSEMLEKQVQSKARVISEFGKIVIKHLMVEGKSNHVQEILLLAVKSHQVSNAFILKNDGTVFLSAKSENTPKKFQLDKFKDIKDKSGDKFLYVKGLKSQYEYIITPIKGKSECYRCHIKQKEDIGYFALKISIDDVLSAAKEHAIVNVILIIFTFSGLGAVIFVALSLLVTRPVKEMQAQILEIENQMDEIELGGQVQFSQIKKPNRTDEIAGLIDSFNKLVLRLNKAHIKLYEMHQSQLAQADRLITTGEMAANIAHEIKNPLAGALGALEIIMDDMPKDNSCIPIMHEIIVQLERINHAVNDLLSYARPADPVFEKVNLNEIFKRILSLLESQIKAENTKTNLFLSESIPNITADEKLIQQLFWNILLNAVQSMKDSGTLTIKTEKENSTVKITIQDTGKGIPKDNYEKIFKPFFTNKHKGTGLGLAISKRIVEQHSGNISIKSEMGKGTTFIINLPIARLSNKIYES